MLSAAFVVVAADGVKAAVAPEVTLISTRRQPA